MKTINLTERFTRAYDALVKAFFEGTLGKWTCAACACGNIIAEAEGCRLTSDEFKKLCAYRDEQNPETIKKADYILALWANKRDEDYDREEKQTVFIPLDEFKGQYNAAGYTTEEFILIEEAFERNTIIPFHNYGGVSDEKILEDQFNGLCAVVEVLLKLDNISPDEKYNAKFREHPKLVTF